MALLVLEPTIDIQLAHGWAPCMFFSFSFMLLTTPHACVGEAPRDPTAVGEIRQNQA